MIEQDGKFYLYVTFVKPDDKMGTYVLVADRPDGPFHFTAGQGLLPPGEEGTDSPASLMILTENLLLMTMVQDISSGVAGMRDGFLRTGFIWMVSR